MKNRIFIINLLVLFALMNFLDLKADDSWFINGEPSTTGSSGVKVDNNTFYGSPTDFGRASNVDGMYQFKDIESLSSSLNVETDVNPSLPGDPTNEDPIGVIPIGNGMFFLIIILALYLFHKSVKMKHKS